jgi:hypothetical protein
MYWPTRVGLQLVDRVQRGKARYTVQPAEEFDGTFDAFLEQLVLERPATVARTGRYFRWRYGPGSPQAGRRVGVVKDASGALLGYTVVCLARGDPLRVGHVVELETLAPHDPELSRALLGFAVDALRQEGACCARKAPGRCATTTAPRAAASRRRCSLTWASVGGRPPIS